MMSLSVGRKLRSGRKRGNSHADIHLLFVRVRVCDLEACWSLLLERAKVRVYLSPLFRYFHSFSVVFVLFLSFPVMLNGVWVFLCRRDVRKGGLMRWLREGRSLTSRPCHVMDPGRSRPPNALLRGRKRQPGFACSKKESKLRVIRTRV